MDHVVLAVSGSPRRQQRHADVVKFDSIDLHWKLPVDYEDHGLCSEAADYNAMLARLFQASFRYELDRIELHDSRCYWLSLCAGLLTGSFRCELVFRPTRSVVS